MPVVIGARYNPYSFEDMLKPLAMAQQEYNAVQEGLSSLTDSSNQFSRYLDGTQAGERVKAYNAAIDTAVNDMAKSLGLTGKFTYTTDSSDADIIIYAVDNTEKNTYGNKISGTDGIVDHFVNDIGNGSKRCLKYSN